MAWSVGPQKPLCGAGRTCRASQGAAVTVIPGAVFSGSLDGGMRAYSTADGTILWTYDSNRWERDTSSPSPRPSESPKGPIA